MHTRKCDIQPLEESTITIYIDDQPVRAAAGEMVLGVLSAMGRRKISINANGTAIGAYCFMGVCHCCLVEIDGKPRRRACQTPVAPGMRIVTLRRPTWLGVLR
ncbi:MULTISPECIES: (2Fe-2S)-binding protein [Dyella]|uniref:(2Fe-2S)-binding protein n=1 Tax=Dyella TaxID=231454 RepID=UPI001F0EA464|nr:MULTISPECIES: (2Fe-2S)-binding protein [Dyella]